MKNSNSSEQPYESNNEQTVFDHFQRVGSYLVKKYLQFINRWKEGYQKRHL